MFLKSVAPQNMCDAQSKETSMDWPCFETWRTSAWNYWRQKPTRGRRRIQMLHDLANDGDFVALKRAAEDRERWRHR